MNTTLIFILPWQEDAEIDFVDLALEGVPQDHKTDGIPHNDRFVQDYLQRLFDLNKGSLLHRCSELFLEQFN